MMRDKYNSQLESLVSQLSQMGVLCQRAVCASVAVLDDQNVLPTVSDTASSIEVELDHCEHDVESSCIKLILKQQPVAGDLRLISATLKMITDLERIGDQASDIEEIAKEVTGAKAENRARVVLMAKTAAQMIRDSLDALEKEDVELARYATTCDDVIDDAYAAIRSSILKDIAEGNTDGETDLDLFMIAKYLERIGDHTTNVAEWVEFSITGSRPQDDD